MCNQRGTLASMACLQLRVRREHTSTHEQASAEAAAQQQGGHLDSLCWQLDDLYRNLLL
jgi:hypothetical protein